MPWWQLAISATDANRFVIRLARFATGRPRILVFDGCYHGTVDETLHVLRGRPRRAARGTRPADRPGADDTHRRVQRHRGARTRTDAQRCRAGAGRARADEHRHRPSRTRVPRRAARDHRDGTARCSRSTRRTRSASARVAQPRRGISTPTSSWSASRSGVGSRSRRTGSATGSPKMSPTPLEGPHTDVSGIGGTLTGSALSHSPRSATRSRSASRPPTSTT